MRKSLVLLLIFTGIFIPVYATHQRAGEITYKAISDLKYEFTIVTYTYTPSPADRPELEINWGDGTSSVVPRTLKINYPNNISRNEYAGAIHIFPGQGTYTVTLEDPNRNYGILNIPNSVNVPFFIHTQIVINPFLGVNNSVELLTQPIDLGCVNTLYLHNPGAYDSDGDSLSYKLVDCRGAFGLPIPGYILPNLVDTTVPSTFAIDPVTGTIAWNKPILQGEYNIAFIIEEWRNGVRIGYVTRDMQITIIACTNQPPTVQQVADTCIKAGETLTFEVSTSDPDGDDLVLRGVGGPLIQEESPAEFPEVMGQGSVSSVFTWQTNCSHVQLQPYQVLFIARDTFNFPQLTDIKAVNIKVISPPPENLDATAAGNAIHLSWNRVICEKASGYEIYRRNGIYGFTPGVCQTGVPPDIGYELIGVNEGRNDTTFIDDNSGNGLYQGIDYCYIIVALFPDGGKSYASDEVCATLKKDVPVITNVSVINTGTTQGSVYIAWSKPTELDTILFPSPYRYVIRQATDNDPGNFAAIDSTDNINDTIYTSNGLNTSALTYIYKIDMFSVKDGSRLYIGSTRVARSMFLNVEPSDNSLILSWNNEVPWNNDFYTIYRFNGITNTYDSIGFSDRNEYTDTGLVNGSPYSYFIRSTGKYTAEGFINPIINLSQISSGIPVDNVPPCAQILTVKVDCDLVENNLEWENPPQCPEDIIKILIYYKSFDFEDFMLIDSVSGPGLNTYRHSGLASIAGCYAIRAVDSVGNQGELSNVACLDIDTCSVYRLPNVFTPNEDNINDRFIPYEFTSVERIELRIFNRWGKIVFETTDPAINWDGKNMNNNTPCNPGAYFYVCDVYEIRLSGLSKRTLTGSVTIIR